MNVKHKFAEYFVAKRKAANLTQQELADKLYVTNTAVSKWERGLSYPDITLIKSICDILNITAEEFINASDDLATRKSKMEANYYKKIAFYYHAITLSSYLIAIIVSLIVNLTVNGTLSWSIIVIPAVLLAASFTNLPFLHRHVNQETRFQVILIQYVSPLLLLFLLLLTTGIYNSLDWLITSYLGILLGYSILILPKLFKKIENIKKIDSKTKTLFTLITPLVILIVLLLYLCIINNGNWFFVASLGVLVGYEIFILPYIFDVVFQYSKKRNFLLTLGTAILTIIILVLVAHFQFSDKGLI
jgi:transcriptional regulator with XRE-family HTH domain